MRRLKIEPEIIVMTVSMRWYREELITTFPNLLICYSWETVALRKKSTETFLIFNYLIYNLRELILWQNRFAKNREKTVLWSLTSSKFFPGIGSMRTFSIPFMKKFLKILPILSELSWVRIFVPPPLVFCLIWPDNLKSFKRYWFLQISVC